MKAMTTNSLHTWVLATRPRTSTGAIILVLIGSALAFAGDKSDLISVLLCALFACDMQIAANSINDLYDYLEGNDRTDRLGSRHACAQGWIIPIAMKQGIMGILVLSCLVDCTSLRQCWRQLLHGDQGLILLGLLCMISVFLYTTILSYRSWGDLLVLVSFGFVPIDGTYYVQAHVITANMQIVSLIYGLVMDTLLVVNSYRDCEQDVLNSRRMLAIYFGEPFGRYLHLGLGVSAVLLGLQLVYAGKIEPLAFIWALCIYLYSCVLTWRKTAAIWNG